MHCDFCRTLRRSEWLGRLAAEAFTSKAVRFVTLTYDDEHVEAGFPLPPEHFKDYCKARRRKYPFKHFTVGEYGDQTGRPHWHSLQFYSGRVPTEPLNFSSLWRGSGWAKGNSQYELPKSMAACCAYVWDYLDKGGKGLRPSPGIGREYLLDWSRMRARNGRTLTSAAGIRYTVPNSRTKEGKLWEYYFPCNHPWAIDMAEAYIDEWELTRNEEMRERFENISHG